MTRFWLWLWWWVVDPARFIIAFCWVALIIGILIVEWRRNRRVNAIRAEADPACPRCGYLVIRLDGHICPECGADLHATGVVRRDDPRTSPLARIALWTLLLGLPAFQGWRYVETRLPVLNERSVTQISSGPSSKAYKSIEARMTGRRWQWSWQSPSPLPLDRLELRLVKLNGAQKIFHTRLAIPSDVERLALTKKVLAATAPVDLPKALNRDEVSRWIADQGIDSNDPQVVAELAEIAKLIDGRGFGLAYPVPETFARRAMVSTGLSSENSRWMLAGWIGTCLIVWLIGVRRLSTRPTLPYQETAPLGSG